MNSPRAVFPSAKPSREVEGPEELPEQAVKSPVVSTKDAAKVVLT